MCALYHMDCTLPNFSPRSTWLKASMTSKYLEYNLWNTFCIILHDTGKAPEVQQLAGLQEEEKEGLPKSSCLLCMVAWTGLLPPTYLWTQPPATLCCTFVVISLIGCKKIVLNTGRESKDFVLRFPLQENPEANFRTRFTLEFVLLLLCNKTDHFKYKGFHMQERIRKLHVPQMPRKAARVTCRNWTFPANCGKLCLVMEITGIWEGNPWLWEVSRAGC